MNDGEMTIVRRRGMRTGYTTGACAAAASRAATIALLTREGISETTIQLPGGGLARFAIKNCELGLDHARCSVIKDAGDDPDVTHLAEIVATVSRSNDPGVQLRGGVGVGTVTLPGLGLQIDGPAINPVPRSMILAEVLDAAGNTLDRRGLIVEISVPHGVELAKKTLNARLGIIGGISILGTTGIVRPYSTAAYRASVEQGVDVAAANGFHEVVLSTGGRSERFARELLELPEICCVEMGEFTGHALRRATKRGIRAVHLAGMIGKFSKIAQGHLMTHVAGNRVEPAYLAELAGACGAEAELQAQIAQANTARHVQEIVLVHGPAGFFDRVAAEAAERCRAYVKNSLTVEAIIFDFDGAVLGRAATSGGVMS